MLTLRDAGETEIGGFGITAGSDLLLVEEIALVKQQCDWASVEFDDEAVADFFDRQVDQGRTPEQFGRIWIPTHPGNSPRPSGTDEETFARVFGSCDWAVMFILARGGASYARLQFGVGPGGVLELPVEVDYQCEFPATDRQSWLAEYEACVNPLEQDLLTQDADLMIDPWEAYDDLRWSLAEQDMATQDMATQDMAEQEVVDAY